MTEEEARAWMMETLCVSRETLEKLDAFQQMVIEENDRQNLISAGTIDQFWSRHIVDSAQLLSLAANEGVWIDLGTGAGFPGVVIALLRDSPMIFVESRRKRIDFLVESVEKLGLAHVRIHGGRLETMPATTTSVISARAFAPLPKLLNLAHRFSNNETIWVLPKGRSAHEELETVRRSWQGVFHVKQSVTDADAAIITATGVRRIKRAGK